LSDSGQRRILKEVASGCVAMALSPESRVEITDHQSKKYSSVIKSFRI